MRLRDIIEPEALFEVERLTSILDGSHADIRERMRLLLARPEFAYPGRLDHDDYRELVLHWTQTLADEGLGLLGYPEPHGSADPGSFVAAFAMIGHDDLSLLTKFGVQFGLFGGSIARLGRARHHDEYLPAVGSLALPGCFAMTETGHGLIEGGTEPAEAFIEVQTHAATAAASHVERVTLEAFASAVERIDDEASRKTLDRLRTLHGLSTIQADLGWFQEHGRISGTSSRVIRKTHERLVREVADESLALVNAFGIPGQVLAAPTAASQ